MERKKVYQTKHWRELRKRLITGNLDCECYLCHKKKWRLLKRSPHEKRSNFKDNLHHLTYERAGNELDSDVIVLCHRCHELLHSIQGAKPSEGFINDLKAVLANYLPTDSEDIPSELLP